MASIGEASVVLTAKTADFEKGMDRAAKKLSKVLDVSAVKQFVSAMSRAFKAVAEVSEEADQGIKKLEDSWNTFLARFGSGIGMLSGYAAAFVNGPLTNLIKGLEFAAQAAGNLAGGGSIDDLARGVAQQDRDEKFRADSKAAMTSMPLVELVTPEFKARLAAEEKAVEAAEKYATAWREAFDEVKFGTEDMIESIEENLKKAFEQDLKDMLDKIPNAVVGKDNWKDRARMYQASATVAPALARNQANVASQIQTMGTQQAVGGAAMKLVNASPIAGSAVNSAMEGAAVGGPMGALAGVIADLVTKSQPFMDILAQLEPVLQALADTVGDILKPTLSVLADIIKAVTKGILYFMLGLYKAIDKIPGIDMGGHIRRTKERIENLGKAAKDTTDKTKEAAKSLGDLNVPQGVKVALARVASIDESGVSDLREGVSSLSSHGIVINGDVNIKSDKQEFSWPEMMKEIGRRKYVGSTGGGR